MSKLAIIGGTGLSQIENLQITETQKLETPFGSPSAEYIHGHFEGREIIFLTRHGNPHLIPPHKINYRANIWGLQELGATEIIAVAAVGGITSTMAPAHIALPDQIIDYSYGREHSFFADNFHLTNSDTVTHIDFTVPYDEQIRKRLIQHAKQNNINISMSGTYGCTQGPRLETAAEIKRMEQDGCDLVGMTGMPEAALARELNIDYAAIAVVANWAAGKSTGVITMVEIEKYLKQGIAKVTKLLASYYTE